MSYTHLDPGIELEISARVYLQMDIGPAWFSISKLLPGNGVQLCFIKNKSGGVPMVNAETIQSTQGTKRKIDNTTYVVTSHFQQQGTTAVDKIRCLLNNGMKVRGRCQN